MYDKKSILFLFKLNLKNCVFRSSDKSILIKLYA